MLSQAEDDNSLANGYRLTAAALDPLRFPNVKVQILEVRF